MSVKMFEWEQDQGTELTVQSVVGIDVSAIEDEARERQLGLARAEALASQAHAGIALLRDVAKVMSTYKDGDAPVTFATDHLDKTSYTLLSEVLGKGEVFGHAGAPDTVRIQESVFPGLWRMKSDQDNEGQECLVIADVPPMLRFQSKKSVDSEMHIPQAGEGVMNAMPVLAEIRDRVKNLAPSAPNHVINFTLLPMSEGDMAMLRETLGVGHVNLQSKGYGSCRVCSTRWPNVWSVQFFNVMDTVILDTIEIGDVPVSVCAAGDDFVDSATRIEDIIEAYL